MRAILIATSGLTSAILLATPAWSQDQSRGTSDNPLVECIGIEDDEDRLACFDRAIQGQQAQAADDEAAQPIGPERASGGGDDSNIEEERRTRRFGLPMPSLPRLSFFNSERDSDSPNADPAYVIGPDTQILEQSASGEVTSVRMTVAEVTEVGYGTQRFTMTNGQVWEVIGGEHLRIPRRTSVIRAEIRKGALSSYRMRLNDRTSQVRVRRIDR